MGYDADKGIFYMPFEVAKKLFTVDEYYRMADAGIIVGEDRVELIDGEILTMNPIGTPHALCVMQLTHLFVTAVTGRGWVSVQSSIQLNNYTEPEPDIVLLKPGTTRKTTERISAKDALLVVEVADTSLAFDRKIKVPRYAAAGIPETWIVNLNDTELLVFRNPSESGYTTTFTLHRGDTVSPVTFSDLTFDVDGILGLQKG
jgi:Uma2 family endonuclease